MKGDKISLSQKQLQRFHVMKMVEEEKMTLGEAAKLIGVSYRHAKRIKKKVEEKGAKGLIHGNTGRAPGNQIPAEVKKKVLDLSQTQYLSFNDHHFWEHLLEEEGVDIGRETVRKIRRDAGIAPKKKRRPRLHRKRRERRSQAGAMALWDGSPHRWFGPDQPPCCLMVAMDDAQGDVLAARFFPFEGTLGYLWLLREMVSRHGIPLCIYQDRHGSLKRNDDHWTLEEQLQGRQLPTQVGLALEALAIRPIFALSAQAKGRIERLFRTLQDRLGAELAKARVKALPEANRFLTPFLRRFNRRFRVAPRNSESAWRSVPPHLDLDRAISFRYAATVGLDNAVRLGEFVIDIPPGPNRKSYAKAKIEARQLLDGSWRIYYQNTLIATHASTALHEPLRALPQKRMHIKAAKSSYWIYQASAQPKPTLRGHIPLGIKGTY
jgi:transposase